jgi:Cof subfamily protein (haloacid dehalogenase superfamily)
VRLLAIDLDGTVLDSQMRISARVRRALRLTQEAGVHVILASGRIFSSMRLLAADLGLNEPMICHQGALVQDLFTQQVYYRCGVPLPLAQELVVIARQQGWSLGAYLDEHFYVERDSPFLRFYVEFSPTHEEIHIVPNLGDMLVEPLKLILVAEPEEATRADLLLRERFAGRLHIVRSFPLFVEATNWSVSKGCALAFLAEKLGVTQSETMAIGDNDNDIEMVAWAGWGVAMGNASAALKATAAYIAPSLADDGAAQAIERFILGEHDDAASDSICF